MDQNIRIFGGRLDAGRGPGVAADHDLAAFVFKDIADSRFDGVVVNKEGAEVTLDGKIQDGKAGIGGQSTGRVLKYATKAGQGSIEVDCSALGSGKIP